MRNIIARLFRSFRASRLFWGLPRGDALRACPWLSYSAPLALSGVEFLCAAQTEFPVARRVVEFPGAEPEFPWRGAELNSLALRPNSLSAAQTESVTLLDADAVGAAAAEGFRVVHFLGFGWRHDEISGGGGARDVRIFVHAFPQ